MDKTRRVSWYPPNRRIFEGNESSRDERGSFFVSSMVGWFELMAITILWLSCTTFVMYKVWKFSILVSHVHSQLQYSYVKEECDIRNRSPYVVNVGRGPCFETLQQFQNLEIHYNICLLKIVIFPTLQKITPISCIYYIVVKLHKFT